MKTWTLDIEKAENGDSIIQFPLDLVEETGWKEGDRIQWIDRKDGSWELKKIETQYILVECVSQFRQRYVVEVPTDKIEWALDTVVMNESKEFSQKHLGETIVSERVITHDDVLELCDKDNDYARAWSNEKKFETFVTEWKEK